MVEKLDRRGFLRSLVAVVGSTTLPRAKAWGVNLADEKKSSQPLRLGVASYSFRKFGQPEVIQFMKELKTPYLNVKAFHLAMTETAEVGAVCKGYRAAGITLTAAGTIYFAKDDDADMRSKFEYVKAAGIPL